ncbi:NACHT domain-containing protein [Paractinoplanes hotanensis]|uniref:NACHT domain-containing protein n=1 Tax=Paractinoplanes hotanensis TaxID=2906497 RepID=A0ABT0YBW3_9ACTN|nr:NACHT domain-containing protein [Actinoplanes hotanensis]MCM4083556.1 NACHT domain-containing protein [Actinoplanes hotanensis]
MAASREWTIAHSPGARASRGERWAASDEDLAGADLDLVDVWLTRAPSRRLIVLGDAGAGKSELMVRTLLVLLDRRADFGDVVPALVPVASWDFGDVEAWLERWLVRNYRFLGRTAPGDGAGSYARELLRNNRIAVILDGFDELPPDNRKRFLQWLNHDGNDDRPQRMLLLTSRPVEYARLALDQESIRLDGAAGVRLLPQRTGDVVGFLRLKSGPGRWDGVAASIEKGGRSPLSLKRR